MVLNQKLSLSCSKHFVASNAGPRGHCCSCIYSLIISWSGLKSEPKWPRERRVLSFLMRMTRELLEAQLKLKYETNCSQMASHNVINTKNLTAYGSELHCRGCSSQAARQARARPSDPISHTQCRQRTKTAPQIHMATLPLPVFYLCAALSLSLTFYCCTADIIWTVLFVRLFACGIVCFKGVSAWPNKLGQRCV